MARSVRTLLDPRTVQAEGHEGLEIQPLRQQRGEREAEVVVLVRRQDQARQLRAGVEHAADSGAERKAIVDRECETRRGTPMFRCCSSVSPRESAPRCADNRSTLANSAVKSMLSTRASPPPSANASESSVGIRPSAETMTEGQPGLSGQSPQRRLRLTSPKAPSEVSKTRRAYLLPAISIGQAGDHLQIINDSVAPGQRERCGFLPACGDQTGPAARAAARRCRRGCTTGWS
jgi:hypothetical protein